MQNLDDTSGEPQKSQEIAGNKLTEKKKIFIIIGVAVVLLAILWIWKEIAISNERKEARRQIQMMKDKAVILITDSHKEHLKLLAKPYVWAVRSALLNGNTDQVNLYANEMVKEKNFQSIVVANDKGIIISSTNKKHEGKEFSTIGKPNYLTNDTTIVENINDSILVMSSPVMGFNNKLGTMMITYKAKSPNFN